MKPDNPVCHIFDGIIMGHHDYGVAVLPIHIFNKSEDFLGSLIIQRAGRLIAQKQSRIFYNCPAYGCPLLLTSGNLVREFILVLPKPKYLD